MSGLADVALPDLERLLRAARAGELSETLSQEGLTRARLDALAPALGTLLSCDVATVVRVLEAVCEERRRPPATRVALVWSGPETRASAARDTAVVVRELFEGAQRHVLVAGYSFEKGEAILAPLHAAMRDRGVRAELFVHLPEAREVPVDPAWYLRAQAAAWRTAYQSEHGS